jgi:MoxR-like ATPase
MNEERLNWFRETTDRIKSEVGKVIVGQDEVVEGILLCLLAGGHVLLEGVPGVGKTKIVRTLSAVLDLKFSRIQFTPDLMPADITGTDILVETPEGDREFQFRPGPIFANIVLADEINRATPRTQSALLEAMQEEQVTVSGKTYRLDAPFVVLATQNPIEMEGTYTLPEAQLDRFTFKLKIGHPTHDEMREILHRTTYGEEPIAERVIGAEEILEMRKLIRDVPIASHVEDYIIRLVKMTHPSEGAPDIVRRYVEYGSSVRGAQAMTLTAKARALCMGRYNVSIGDVRAVAMPALRHRIIRSYEAEVEGIDADQIIEELLGRIEG